MSQQYDFYVIGAIGAMLFTIPICFRLRFPNDTENSRSHIIRANNFLPSMNPENVGLETSVLI